MHDVKNKKTRLSVSVGISCLNEEGNIANLLTSILAQAGEAFFINEIIVASDGSRDRTVEKIKSIKNSRIKLIAGLKRLGKPQRLNEIFDKASGDVLVLLDADITLASSRTINNLVEPFLKNINIGMTSGSARPIEGKTFIEKSINASVRAYQKLIDDINNGNNVFACEGRILALSSKLAEIVRLPKETVATDAYLYFFCITRSYLFKYKKSAQVRYFSPKTISEQINQNKRFEARRYILKRYFGDIVDKELKIPKLLYIKTMIPQIINDPIYSLSIFIINTYTRYIANKEKKKINSLWDVALSTKKEIKI